MPMRQEDAVDRSQLDPEPCCVVKPRTAVRADVEQDAAHFVPVSSSQEHREPVAGNAQVLKRTHAGVPVVVASWWHPLQERCHFGDLVDARVDTRQGVGLVVDHDDHLEVVQHGEVIDAHRTMLAPAGLDSQAGEGASALGGS